MCELKNGYTPSKSKPEFWEDGDIPWFRMEDIRTNGRILSDSIQHITREAVKGGKLFPAGSIILSTTATIGEHALLLCDALANQQITNVSIKEVFMQRLMPKYLFYYMFKIGEWCRNNVNSSSFASVEIAKLKKVIIPIPPMRVQTEIVRILDMFSELINELSAELELRKKQYYYYREKLLKFTNDTAQFLPLGEVMLNIRTGLNPRKNFKLNTEDANNFYITVQELNGLYLDITDATDKVNDEALGLISKRSMLQVGDILFSGTGTIGRMHLITEPPHNWNIKEGIYAITPNNDIVTSKYLFRVLESEGVELQLKALAMGGTVQSVSMANLKTIKIPIPPIAEQERIVAILDKFDSLVNSISEGIPAEINLRQKQYEYYRNALLSFN